jgi:hypothetical protein
MLAAEVQSPRKIVQDEIACITNALYVSASMRVWRAGG